MANILSVNEELYKLNEKIKHAEETLAQAIKHVNQERQDMLNDVNIHMDKLVTHMESHQKALLDLMGVVIDPEPARRQMPPVVDEEK